MKENVFNSEVSPQLQVDNDNQTYLSEKTFARQKPTLRIRLHIVSVKSRSARGECLQPAFMGSCQSY